MGVYSVWDSFLQNIYFLYVPMLYFSEFLGSHDTPSVLPIREATRFEVSMDI